MTVAELRSHLAELPDNAVVEVQVDDPEVARGPGWAWVRGLVFAITTGNRYGREVVILNAR